MKFRKKPVVIDAVQWTGDKDEDVMDFLSAEDIDRDVTVSFVNNMIIGIVAHTLEGDHTATLGDYLIKGVKGEVYFCKPDIFDMTYEVAE